MQMAKYLQSQQMNVVASEKFLKDLLTSVSQIKNPEYDIRQNRSYQKILNLFDCEAKGLSLVGHTKWGMLNAVTEYFDHHAPSRSNDARLDNAWFGTGETIKNKATDLLLV